MVYCPACEASMDLDEDQLQEGGVLNCDGCGVRMEVVNVNPLQLERLGGDEDEDLEDDDVEDDEDLDEDDEDEDEDDEEEDGYDDEDDDYGRDEDEGE